MSSRPFASWTFSTERVKEGAVGWGESGDPAFEDGGGAASAWGAEAKADARTAAIKRGGQTVRFRREGIESFSGEAGAYSGRSANQFQTRTRPRAIAKEEGRGLGEQGRHDLGYGHAVDATRDREASARRHRRAPRRDAGQPPLARVAEEGRLLR